MEDEENILNDDDAMDILPDDYTEETLTSRTYNINDGRVIGMVDDYEAIVKAVDKILNTERYVYPIYSENYGSDLPDLVGEDFDYIKIEAERMLDEALRADDRITSVYVDSVSKVGEDSLLIAGTVESVFGNVDFEKEVTAEDE